ncbi:TetR/AcrR family transcriptional regulator [Rhodococcus jostii]|uniref:TetR/AcrR family transcriptional regulator n=1 Tax=Rhodococcus jostii TaxID=132919 RepID=UPI001ED8DE8F|nr:TetR/AcrR family transcriptional regulator [Rhodococcus jostii]
MIVIQQRARVTRNSVLQRAAEEFDRNGYVNTTLEIITGHSGVGKGAVYHHFTSKPALADAVISEGMNRMGHLRSRLIRRHPRAVEALIELSYTLADAGRREAMVRAAFRLVREIGDSSGHLRTTTIHTWTEAFRGLVERAIAREISGRASIRRRSPRYSSQLPTVPSCTPPGPASPTRGPARGG